MKGWVGVHDRRKGTGAVFEVLLPGRVVQKATTAGSDATVQVQYKEADEWYTVTGGKATLKDPADAAAVHQVVVGILNRPEG